MGNTFDGDSLSNLSRSFVTIWCSHQDPNLGFMTPEHESHGLSCVTLGDFHKSHQLTSSLCIISVLLPYSPTGDPIQPLVYVIALSFSGNILVLPCSLMVQILAQEIISYLGLRSQDWSYQRQQQFSSRLSGSLGSSHKFLCDHNLPHWFAVILKL